MNCFNYLKIIVFTTCVFALTGCTSPADEHLDTGYRSTVIKQSNPTYVLAAIHKPEHELLSQSGSIVVSWGEKRKGKQVWFNMVRFDENNLYAQRKYFFTIDETPLKWPVLPKEFLRIEAKVVLSKDVLEEPYANNNLRRIGFIKQILNDFRDDIAEVRNDNTRLDEATAMVNQMLERSLYVLEKSNAKATWLNTEKGMDIDHPTLGKGRMWLTKSDDVAELKVLIKNRYETWENPFSLTR